MEVTEQNEAAVDTNKDGMDHIPGENNNEVENDEAETNEGLIAATEKIKHHIEVRENVDNVIDLTETDEDEISQKEEMLADDDKENVWQGSGVNFKIPRIPRPCKGRPKASKRKLMSVTKNVKKQKDDNENGKGSQHEQCQSIKNVSFTQNDLSTLDGEAWLNDKVCFEITPPTNMIPQRYVHM